MVLSRSDVWAEENDMTCCLIQRNRTFWTPSLDSPQSQVCISDPPVPPPHNICHTQFTSSIYVRQSYLLQLGSHPFPLGNTGASTESGPEKGLKFFVEWMKNYSIDKFKTDFFGDQCPREEILDHVYLHPQPWKFHRTLRDAAQGSLMWSMEGGTSVRFTSESAPKMLMLPFII